MHQVCTYPLYAFFLNNYLQSMSFFMIYLIPRQRDAFFLYLNSIFSHNFNPFPFRVPQRTHMLKMLSAYIPQYLLSSALFVQILHEVYMADFAESHVLHQQLSLACSGYFVLSLCNGKLLSDQSHSDQEGVQINTVSCTKQEMKSLHLICLVWVS